MRGATEKTQALIDSLGELSPVGEVLAEVALALADDVDHPSVNEKGDKQSMVSAPANALRACLADLVAKGRAHADEDGDASGWADIAASAGATPIRDTTKSGARDVGRRGRGGGKAAG